MSHTRTEPAPETREALEATLAALPAMDRAQLRRKWREALGSEPPPHLRKQLLVPVLAYRLQEKVYGGLSAGARRKLRELAARYEAGLEAKEAGRTVAAEPFRAKPGTRLLREWRGETHTVTCTERGFEHKGQVYRSLSEIARLITGTRWSGPAFFGLKQQATRKAKAGAQ